MIVIMFSAMQVNYTAKALQICKWFVEYHCLLWQHGIFVM